MLKAIELALRFLELPGHRQRLITKPIEKYLSAHRDDRLAMQLCLLVAAIFAFFTVTVPISGVASGNSHHATAMMCAAMFLSSRQAWYLFKRIYRREIRCH